MASELKRPVKCHCGQREFLLKGTKKISDYIARNTAMVHTREWCRSFTHPNNRDGGNKYFTYDN